jgi:hypothetical protein
MIDARHQGSDLGSPSATASAGGGLRALLSLVRAAGLLLRRGADGTMPSMSLIMLAVPVILLLAVIVSVAAIYGTSSRNTRERD